ncbi:MAG TPA: hypothetical protein VEI26_13680 [Terriglobales bacterium]|nr:hypothetical protein [Terriglobales bacterium]
MEFKIVPGRNSEKGKRGDYEERSNGDENQRPSAKSSTRKYELGSRDEILGF